jgi:hypothetical protein
MNKMIESINIHNFDNNEMSGGYSIDQLLDYNNDQNNDQNMVGGGSPNVFADLQIPLGLHYVDEIASNFYKAVNSNVIEDDLFDRLFDLVSKTKNKGTRREQVKKHKVTKRTRQ